MANMCWIIEKAREFQKKNIYFCFTDYTKAFDSLTINCGKFLKRWDYQTTWSAFWEVCMQVRKQQLEPDMEQQAGSKSKFNFYAEYIIRNAGLEEAQAGIKIAKRNINNLRYADDTTLMAESEEEL